MKWMSIGERRGRDKDARGHALSSCSCEAIYIHTVLSTLVVSNRSDTEPLRKVICAFFKEI